MGRTGGVYIPPFKLAQMREMLERTAASDEEKQKLSWEALRKSINGLINKVNVNNIKNIVPELFQENLIRGRGLFARAIMKAQLASPGFTHIYAALIAIISTKLPENGELILKRVIVGFKRAYKRRDKLVATALAKFIAHLVNHQVAHELLALQLITVLLEEPTDDSVEIAVNFTKEVGKMLEELSPQGLHAIFERFRGILHEGEIDKRVQFTIEGLFAIRKSKFQDYPAIPPELDLVEREDLITFELGLDDDIDKEEMLDIFRYDPNYEENERLWEQVKKEILGDDDDEEEYEEAEAEEAEAVAEDNTPVASGQTKILDMSEQDLINLRRTIYLTIMSSVSFEECVHKIAKLNVPEGYEHELCQMLVECCANEKSYLKFYGLVGQRLCMLQKRYQDSFDKVFHDQYTTIHRLETNKLRNVAKFFAHILATDALPWTCLEYIRLNEDDTTSSSRIFIKILIQDLSENLGLRTLRERFNDPYMQVIFGGLFPKDTARNTRFAINFFTSIGLGLLTDELRDHLKNAPKLLAQQMQSQLAKAQESSDSSSDSSSDNSSDSSSSSSSDSGSDSDSDSDSDSSSDESSSDTSSSASSEVRAASMARRSDHVPADADVPSLTKRGSEREFEAPYSKRARADDEGRGIDRSRGATLPTERGDDSHLERSYRDESGGTQGDILRAKDDYGERHERLDTVDESRDHRKSDVRRGYRDDDRDCPGDSGREAEPRRESARDSRRHRDRSYSEDEDRYRTRSAYRSDYRRDSRRGYDDDRDYDRYSRGRSRSPGREPERRLVDAFGRDIPDAEDSNRYRGRGRDRDYRDDRRSRDEYRGGRSSPER